MSQKQQSAKNVNVQHVNIKTKLVLLELFTTTTNSSLPAAFFTDQLCDVSLSCLHDGATTAEAKWVELLWFLLGKFTYTTEFLFIP